MMLKRPKEFFAELEKADLGTFMNEYLKVYNEMQKLLIKSQIRNNTGGQHARYNVNLHYKIRQGTITLEKFGAAFRARTIEIEKRKREGYNYD